MYTNTGSLRKEMGLMSERQTQIGKTAFLTVAIETDPGSGLSRTTGLAGHPGECGDPGKEGLGWVIRHRYNRGEQRGQNFAINTSLAHTTNKFPTDI